MNLPHHRFAAVLSLSIVAITIFGCSTAYTPQTTTYPPQDVAIPAYNPAVVESPDPAFLYAQATIDTGRNQLLELSRKETQNSLNLSQAAAAAAQSTKDFNQRQKAELNYQATVISMNMAQAAATQKYVLRQTEMARDATTAAENSAATAAQAAYLINVDQTAQVQAVLDAKAQRTAQAAAALTAYPLTATHSARLLNETRTVQAQAVLNAQANQTAQAAAALTAYPLTATPFAITQAALLMQEYAREQGSFVNQIVVPLIPILIIVDLIAFIVVIIQAYRHSMLMPRPQLPRLAPANVTHNPVQIIDGVIVEIAQLPTPQMSAAVPPGDPNAVHVEIVNAAEAPFAQWVAEVEHQMTVEGGV